MIKQMVNLPQVGRSNFGLYLDFINLLSALLHLRKTTNQEIELGIYAQSFVFRLVLY